MIVCPVCEHQQAAGLECEQCGKSLGASTPSPQVVTQPLEGFEATVPAALGEVAVERLGDLEATRVDVGEVSVERFGELDATRAAPVGDVAVERVDLSEDRVADDGIRTALPTGAVACRYCKTVQPVGAGRVCNRCGMALPRVAVATPTTGSVPGRAGAPATVRCRSCGAPAKVGMRCGDCGRDVLAPEA